MWYKHLVGCSETCEKSDKKNLRIISKPDAYHLTVTKTHVKFRKDRHKTVGDVEHTRYLLLKREGAEVWKYTEVYERTEKRKAELHIPSFFFFLKKGGGQKMYTNSLGNAHNYMLYIGV